MQDRNERGLPGPVNLVFDGEDREVAESIEIPDQEIRPDLVIRAESDAGDNSDEHRRGVGRASGCGLAGESAELGFQGAGKGRRDEKLVPCEANRRIRGWSGRNASLHGPQGTRGQISTSQEDLNCCHRRRWDKTGQ